MEIILRLIAGFIIQVLPFSNLYFSPFQGRLPYSKRKIFAIIFAMVLSYGVFFGCLGYAYYYYHPTSYTQVSFVINLLFLLGLCICFILSTLLINDHWYKKLFSFIFTCSIALIITSITNLILNSSQLVADATLPYDPTTLIVLPAISLLILPCAIHIVKKYLLPIWDHMSSQIWINTSVILGIWFICFAIIGFTLSYDATVTSVNAVILLLFSIMTLFLFNLIFRLLNTIYQNSLAQDTLTKLSQQIFYEQEQYKHIQHSMESIRRQRHDLKHHLLVVSQFINNRNLDGLEKYMQEYKSSSALLATVYICDNHIIDALVNHYLALCRESNIKFEYHIDITSKLLITDTDLCVLLANLLENAYHACTLMDVSEIRFMDFHLLDTSGMLVITVDNSYNGILKPTDSLFASTKEQHTGIGLKSIQHIVEKYDGSFSMTPDSQIFRSSIAMKNIAPCNRTELSSTI